MESARPPHSHNYCTFTSSLRVIHLVRLAGSTRPGRALHTSRVRKYLKYSNCPSPRPRPLLAPFQLYSSSTGSNLFFILTTDLVIISLSSLFPSPDYPVTTYTLYLSSPSSPTLNGPRVASLYRFIYNRGLHSVIADSTTSTVPSFTLHPGSNRISLGEGFSRNWSDRPKPELSPT